MCVSAFVCLSAIVLSLKNGAAHSSVHVVVCVLFCVCTGVYLYKDVGGVLDLGVTVQTVRHSPFHPLIQVSVEALPWS